jgi:hypothetical protein
MKHFRRSELNPLSLPGRVIQNAVGKDGLSTSTRVTVGFARYSAESGAMEPHNHAEEVVYILDAKNGWVRYGPERDKLGERVTLERGMVLHSPPLEWHVFGYDEGGHVDIVFIYGQVDNIRPEDITDV